MEVQLIAAIRDGDLGTLQELLNDPANEGYTYTFMGGATPLHWAAQEGKQDVLRLFLERKTNPIDTKDSTGSTALHWAADEGQTESMKQLIDHGANVNAADMEGETALIRAALMGHTDTLLFLLKSGADINAVSTSGTALHAAVLNSNGDCIKELIKADADPQIANKEGKTALQLVEEKSPQLKTFFDKNTNTLRDEVDSLRKELEEWKRRAIEAETKYETSQKKLMQVYNDLKHAEDGLKVEQEKTEELEKRVHQEEERVQELAKQSEEANKQKDEEIAKLREECEKNKETADQGQLFKVSQDMIKLRELLGASENAKQQLSNKLSSVSIELEVEMKLRKQLDEKNRQLRSELQKLRLERGTDQPKFTFADSERVIRQLDVVKRSFSSLQEVLRIAEKSISHTTVQIDAFKVYADKPKDESEMSDAEANDEKQSVGNKQGGTNHEPTTQAEETHERQEERAQTEAEDTQNRDDEARISADEVPIAQETEAPGGK